MILLDNACGELGANSAFAFLADSENVNGVLHGSESGDEGKEEMTSLLCCCSQGLVVVYCFNDDALIVGAVDEEKAFHGEKAEERLAPREVTIQQKGAWMPLINKTKQCLESSHKLLEVVPHPFLLSARAQQFVAFVVNDGIASAVHVAFKLTVPNAFASAIRAVDGHHVLSVLHCLSDVEDELLERGGLIGAFGGREVVAVVLVGTNGSHHCGESEGT